MKEKITLFLERNSEGGVDIKFHSSDDYEEHLLVPRRQPTNFTVEGDFLSLKLEGGDIFILLDETGVSLFFIWNGGTYKTSEGEVVGLYKKHNLPMPFSIYYDCGVPQLNQQEWMII